MEKADATIATRGMTQDSYGDKVERIILQRTDWDSVNEALRGKHFDVAIDKIAYCSNDIKYVMDVVNCDKYIYMSSTSVYDPKTIDVKEDDFDAIAKEFRREHWVYVIFRKQGYRAGNFM